MLTRFPCWLDFFLSFASFAMSLQTELVIHERLHTNEALHIQKPLSLFRERVLTLFCFVSRISVVTRHNVIPFHSYLLFYCLLRRASMDKEKKRLRRLLLKTLKWFIALLMNIWEFCRLNCCTQTLNIQLNLRMLSLNQILDSAFVSRPHGIKKKHKKRAHLKIFLSTSHHIFDVSPRSLLFKDIVPFHYVIFDFFPISEKPSAKMNESRKEHRRKFLSLVDTLHWNDTKSEMKNYGTRGRGRDGASVKEKVELRSDRY